MTTKNESPRRTSGGIPFGREVWSFSGLSAASVFSLPLEPLPPPPPTSPPRRRRRRLHFTHFIFSQTWYVSFRLCVNSLWLFVFVACVVFAFLLCVFLAFHISFTTLTSHLHPYFPLFNHAPLHIFSLALPSFCDFSLFACDSSFGSLLMFRFSPLTSTCCTRRRTWRSKSTS